MGLLLSELLRTSEMLLFSKKNHRFLDFSHFWNFLSEANASAVLFSFDTFI